MFFKQIYSAGDKFEDRVRGKLSHFPITYALVGGVGVVFFWRGVWHTIDSVMEHYFAVGEPITSTSIGSLPWWDGPLSMILGAAILLMVGLFVSNFIGNEIIISGLNKEKKLTEKTEEEIKVDLAESAQIKAEIHAIDQRLKRMESVLKK